MEKVLSYNLTANGIIPEEVLCGGVQGEHRATALHFTPDQELTAAIEAVKAEGKSLELTVNAVTDAGEVIRGENREGDNLFEPFYLTSEMTCSGLDITVVISLCIKNTEGVKSEIYKAQLKLYFEQSPIPCETVLQKKTESEKLCKKAQELTAALEDKAREIEERMDLKLEDVKANASTSAAHLKKMNEVLEEAEGTKAALENGIEFVLSGGDASGGIDAVFSDEKEKLILNGTFGYREDTLQNWVDSNPILEKGEPAIVRDGNDDEWLKIGDGITPWRELPYRKGLKGEQGEQGLQGEKGEKGEQGEKGDKGDKGDTPEIDQAYSPTSANAQSGVAVAEAVANKVDKTEWQLVEDITLEEAVTEIVISYDKLKGFKELYINGYIIPNDTTQNLGNVLVGKSGRVYWQVNVTSPNNQYFRAYCYISPLKNMVVEGSICRWYHTGATDYTSGYFDASNAEGLLTNGEIVSSAENKFWIRCPNSFGVGTAIKVWGRE